MAAARCIGTSRGLEVATPLRKAQPELTGFVIAFTSGQRPDVIGVVSA